MKFTKIIGLAIFAVFIVVLAACSNTASNSSESEKSSEKDTTPPSNVVNLVTKAGNGMAVLIWADATEDDIFGYEVTWVASYQNRSVIGVIEVDSIFVAPNTQKCIVANLQNGIEYKFTVKTMDTSGNKSQGVATTATPQVSLGATTVFNVEYYQQNIDDDGYTLVAEDTETEVMNTVSKQYTGFHLVKTVNETTASDGSVVVKFYYDRNIVTVTFKLDGGTTETILNKNGTLTGKFGALMGICNPTKQGFIFKGWEPDLQGRFPAQDTVCTAVWYNDAVQSIELDNAVVLVVGRKTIKLNAVVKYADGTTSNTATWTSSDESFATVDDYGNITTYMPSSSNGGTVTITAKSSYQTATCTLYVISNVLTQAIFRNTICSVLGTTYYEIEEFDIPNGITDIEEGVFCDCGKLQTVTFPDSIMKINTYRMFMNCMLLKTIVLPTCLTEISDYAFYNCRSLTSVIIPEGVTRVAGFYYCDSLKKIELPNSVTEIGKSAFQCCKSLENIVIPNNVKKIGQGAFIGCAFRNITIPESVKEIELNYMFWECKLLENVTMPSNVKVIDNCTFAFKDCISLISITIPKGISNIGDEMFSNCASLQSIVIPKSVTKIGLKAFGYCNELNTIEFEDPNGWWYSANEYAASGTTFNKDDLSNASTAATYLKSKYSAYYWHKS